MGFTNFPAAIAGILQQGFLERQFQEGLDSVLAYRRESVEETIPVRIGQTLTKTRTGRFAPSTTPLSPTSNSGLDNGLTTQTYSIEQYSFNMNEYANTIDVDIRQDLAAIADQMFTYSRNLGVQAAQSLERICRNILFSAYDGGNTYVRTDLGASTTTTCHVDDVTGFQNVLVNGVVTPVSGSNTLTVQESAAASGGVTQTLTVTGVTADATNHSQSPTGVSGVLTFSTATAPVNGDALVGANAPKVIRPANRLTTALLKGSDILTLGLCLDAATYLRDNAVPPMADGTYHLILDNTSMRALYADQDFKVAYAGRYQSREFQDGEVVQLFGITFIPTTETLIEQVGAMNGGGISGNTQATIAAGAATTTTTATGPAALTTRVRRPIMLGGEVIIQGNFEGNEIWQNRDGVESINEIYIVNHVAHIVRPPLSRLGNIVSMSYDWIGDFAVPTDLTATTSIIPTASNALFKRAVVVETAG